MTCDTRVKYVDTCRHPPLYDDMVLLWLLVFLFIIVGNVRTERVFIYTDWFEWLYEPSSEELQRGIAIQPPSSWAHRARKERSARILALGNLI